MVLKNALDAEYDIQFPDYNEKLGGLTNFIKTAKNNLRYRRQEVEERLYKEEKEKRKEEEGERMRKEENERTTVKENEWREGLKMEEDALNLKIIHLLDLFDMTEVEDVNEINEFITNVEAFNNQCFDLCARLKCRIGEEYEELYAQKFDKWTRNLHVKEKEAITLKRNILVERENKIRKSAKEIERLNQHELAKNLSKEICVKWD